MEGKTTAKKTVTKSRERRPGALWGKPGEVWCTVTVIEGVLPSGVPYRTESVVPERTPEEEAAWERRIAQACREFIEDCIREHGYEWARERLEVKS